jgi:hypothetical protein
MNTVIQFKRTSALFVSVLVLACFAFQNRAQAVSPAPDGGYPGGNTAEGQNALFSLTTGGFNTAFGFLSLKSNTTGELNTAIGAGTLFANTANDNTATGAGALLSNTTGTENTANGAFALFSNSTGNDNTAVGSGALASNSNLDNTAMGYQALHNELGSFNTAIGYSALANHTVGTNNTALGFQAGIGVMTASNVICIGSAGADVNDSAWIGNVYNTPTVSGTTLPVIVSDGGQLGTVPSSRRFKKGIKPMDSASEAILRLKPVTFLYKTDKTNTPQFGLIADEVAEVNPDLAVRDNKGEIYTVRYDAVNAMLLNEFLKEHKKVQEQGATIAQQRRDFEMAIAKQQKQIETLTAGLQKVSAQLEVSKSAPQTVLNNQ